MPNPCHLPQHGVHGPNARFADIPAQHLWRRLAETPLTGPYPHDMHTRADAERAPDQGRQGLVRAGTGGDNFLPDGNAVAAAYLLNTNDQV